MTILTILGASGRMRARVLIEHLRFLVLGIVLLIIAAVVFGGLAGQPHPDEIGAAVASGNLSTTGAEVFLAQSWALAACAVTLLAMGGLCMFWGIVAVASHDWAELTIFVARAYALLAPLAIYEVAFFTLRAVDLSDTLPKAVTQWGEACAGVAAAVVLFASNWKLWRLQTASPPMKGEEEDDDSADGKPTGGNERLTKNSLRLAGASAGLAVVGYALAPDHTTNQEFNWMDRSMLIAGVLSGFLFAAFLVASARALRSQIPFAALHMEPAPTPNQVQVAVAPVHAPEPSRPGDGVSDAKRSQGGAESSDDDHAGAEHPPVALAKTEGPP
ncbi:hypothetical protein N865_19990 [Intrasporangium oryzae NRRL B-24470]|uniref:Uncharacterized protein n=1 Tax=Intrasporangium oryzae NRRL B-24470 TaxID=1386089 RepID=W9G7P0_9MICO|nr:hypothetical protein [Intrasporangium oryzae]EWS99888.1 hypothetical protein N865_19990 [Intrasporangium oryzae NRRL B-24470]